MNRRNIAFVLIFAYIWILFFTVRLLVVLHIFQFLDHTKVLEFFLYTFES